MAEESRSWAFASRARVEALAQALTDPARSVGKTELVRRLMRIEAQVAADPSACLRFEPTGEATLSVEGGSFRAGRFEQVPLGQLLARARAHPDAGKGSVRFSVLHGVHPTTDVGALQASCEVPTLFQVASQLNALEAPTPTIVPVAEYPFDNTQGPRASVSAFPGTFLRHYAAPAPTGIRGTQGNGFELNALARAVPPEVAAVRHGYLTPDDVYDPAGLAEALERRFEEVLIAVHEGVEVAYGCDWGGPVLGPERRVAQVFSAAMALAYGTPPPRPAREALLAAAETLLRANYLGTLLAGLELRQARVVLTLVGGGVFGNPLSTVYRALRWALDAAAPLASQPLEVVLNARVMFEQVGRSEVLADVRERGGELVEFSAGGFALTR